MKIFHEALLLRLTQVSAGYEAELVEQHQSEGKTVFLTLGRFDILTAESVSTLARPSKPDFSSRTLRTSEVLAYAAAPHFAAVSQILEHPAVVITLIKLRPGRNGLLTLVDELAAAESIRSKAKGAVLHSTGGAEVVLIQGGNDLAGMLREATRIRAVMADTIASTNSVVCISADADSRSTLVPDGSLDLRTAVRCSPAAEGAVASIGEGSVTNTYGWQDVVIDHAENDIAKVVQAVLDFRRDHRGSVIDTAVSASLPLAAEYTVGSSDAAPGQYGEAVREMVRIQIERLSTLVLRDPPLRSELDALSAAISSAANGADLGTLGLEQVVTFQYVVDGAAALGDRGDERDRLFAENALRRLSRHLSVSLHQRSAGNDHYLDAGLGISNVAVRPQARLAAAAAAMPWTSLRMSVSKLVRTPEGKPFVWPYCLTFGMHDSPTYADQAVSMPDEALSQPIAHWWRAHHEVGHAVYRAINFEDRLKASATRWFREITQMSSRSLAPVDVTGYLEELFAQWFDFVFAFGMDDEAYQCAIWGSWLKIRRVWQRKEEYVARSLAIYMYSREAEWLSRAHSRKASLDFLLACLDEMSVVLCERVPEFSEYWDQLQAEAKRMAVRNVDVLLPLISPPLRELYEALAQGAPAAYTDLDRHVEAILRGEVVLDGVVNPAALLARCRTRLFEDHGGAASVSQDIALAVTLWNHQQKTQADEVSAAELIETSA